MQESALIIIFGGELKKMLVVLEYIDIDFLMIAPYQLVMLYNLIQFLSIYAAKHYACILNNCNLYFVIRTPAKMYLQELHLAGYMPVSVNTAASCKLVQTTAPGVYVPSAAQVERDSEFPPNE